MSSHWEEAGAGALASPFAPPGEAWMPDGEAWAPDGEAPPVEVAEDLEALAGEPAGAHAEDALFEAEEYVRHADYIGAGEEEAVAEEEAEFLGGLLGNAADRVQALLRQGLHAAAVGMMIAAGVRDENRLTNVVFHARHPELGGRSLRRDERALVDEWVAIRNQVIRPLLATGAGAAAGAGAGAGTGPRRRLLTSAQLRDAWQAYRGAEGRMRRMRMWGLRWNTPVNPETVDAWRAFERALAAAGYQPHIYWVYNDRNIAGSSTKSLHAYGLAIDIDHRDPTCNVNRRTTAPVRFSDAPTKAERCRAVRDKRADTSFTRAQVDAVLAIETVDGHQVFAWGGYWPTTKDTMHFQVNVTPQQLARGIRPGSVAGSGR